MGEANPFVAIRSELRSEEDDIRRGVFSRALRNLALSTGDEKAAWCAIIDEEEKQKRSRSKKESDEVGVKRAREDGGLVEELEPPQRTTEEANRFVGYFLHSQIEKAIGGTLNSLSPGTLRVLCAIVGLHSRARSKETLYNMLASFHYTHCEVLGKRVSRSTIVDAQEKQDANAMSLLSKKKRTTAAKPTKEAPLPSASPSPVSVVQPSPPLPKERKKLKPQPAAGFPTVTSVAYPAPVFQQPLASSSYLDRPSMSDSEWTPQRLEKSIATIIRNYDPVTVTIIVKKLAQIGYSEPRASDTVETYLHHFHQKQYIHYENGIAYCMD